MKFGGWVNVYQDWQTDEIKLGTEVHGSTHEAVEASAHALSELQGIIELRIDSDDPTHIEATVIPVKNWCLPHG